MALKRAPICGRNVCLSFFFFVFLYLIVIILIKENKKNLILCQNNEKRTKILYTLCLKEPIFAKISLNINKTSACLNYQNLSLFIPLDQESLTVTKIILKTVKVILSK